MRRVSLCPKTGLKRGAWTPEEDSLLTKYITYYGIWNWNLMPKYAGLARCGKSCRLRWLNYLRPNIRRGNFTREEDEFIIRLHPNLGNRWSVIAANLPGRTDNEIKNHWHSHLSKCQKKILTSKVMKREIMASHTPSNRDIENFYDDSSSSSSYDSTIFSNGANWSNMEAMVADLGRADSNGATWNLHFRRRLTDEEVLQVVEMMSLLDGKQLSEEDDQRFWLKTGSIFSVKEACATLTECKRQQGQLGLQNFNRKLVWKRQVPLKICFFLWVLSRGKVLTHDNLERRGFNIVSRCVFCKENSESIQHLFLECSHIREIWYYFWGVMNQQWDGTMTITEVLQRHESQHLNEVGKIYWAVVNHAILWTIWKERNRREFDGEIKQNWQLVSEIKDLIWRWSLGLENTKDIRLESVMFAFGSLVRS